MTRSQKLNLIFVALLVVAYVAASIITPKQASNTYHLSHAAIALLTVSILGLWALTCFFGIFAWLRLDRYANLLAGKDQQAFSRIGLGVLLLAYGLIISSLASAAALPKELSTYINIVIPVLGFWYLRIGTKSLSVSAQAALSLKSKLLTVGPPVLLLGVFYVFLALSNSTPKGPHGPLLLISTALVIATWTLGLLAALNIERATHTSESAIPARPLALLYNGILTMTGGYIILDALISLGNDRIASLPLLVVVALIYAFIAVVGLGFYIVSASARQLIAAKRQSH